VQIASNASVTLLAGASANVTFTWTTSALKRGVYLITAYASSVPGETNLANNYYLWSGTFIVRLKGDVNNDCLVDISDLAITGANNGKTPTSPGYNPYTDINNDGAIDIADLVLIAASNGQHC